MSVVVRLSAEAEADIVRLLIWTQEWFGGDARLRYEALVAAGLADIASEPERLGSSGRPELGEGVRSYHLQHSRDRARTAEGWVRRSRCLLLYRFGGGGLVGVGRVLHDAIEVERHLPEDYGDE